MQPSDERNGFLRKMFVACVAFTISLIVCSFIFALTITLLGFLLPTRDSHLIGYVTLILAIGLSVVGGIVVFRRAWKYLRKEITNV
jgi:hypothetical protein